LTKHIYLLIVCHNLFILIHLQSNLVLLKKLLML